MGCRLQAGPRYRERPPTSKLFLGVDHCIVKPEKHRVPRVVHAMRRELNGQQRRKAKATFLKLLSKGLYGGLLADVR